MRYILCLSYNGRPWCGWQIQPSAPSVQEALESALGRLCGAPVSVTGAGRTDASVNASGYIAHFDLPSALPFPQEDFCYKLNAILPRSVVVHSVVPVSEEFHARFSARKRSYTYFIHRVKDPFVEEFSWQCGYPGLDFAAMNEACRHLLGTHEFSCFEKTGGNAKTSLCTVSEAFWAPYTPSHISVMGSPRIVIPEAAGMPGGKVGRMEAEGAHIDYQAVTQSPFPVFGEGTSAKSLIYSTDACESKYWYFRISADRFLRNMVRAVVGSLIEVGRGKQRPEWIGELVAGGTRSEAGESVPGHALFLNRVEYLDGHSY